MLTRAVRWMVPLFIFLSPLVAHGGDAKEELLAAARKGGAKTVEALLAKGVDVNAKTDYGVTALMYAADKGHLDVVKVLLKQKADANAVDKFYGANAMTWAAYRGHAKIVQALLEAGATGGDSALAMAVQSGRVEVVRTLLEKGKVSATSLSTALGMAEAPARAEIKQLLVKAGAKPPSKTGFAVEEKILQSYAGNYKDPKGVELEMLIVNGSLMALPSEGPALSLTASDATTFKTAGNEPTIITFQRTGDKIAGLTLKRGKTESTFARLETAPGGDPVLPKIEDKPVRVVAPRSWPSFRGPQASGVADGQHPPIAWDVKKGQNIRWKTPIPGLGHSCPVVWEDRIFLTTAVSSDPKATLRPGLYGDVESVNDTTKHSWRVYCLDKRTGQILWERIASEGVPKIKRHLKGTHANPTPATDGKRLIVSFGSEGLFCYDLDGKLLWKRDLGKLESGWFFDPDYQWGFGSSPIIHRDRAIVQCDIGKDSFVAAYDLATGNRAWMTPREEIPSWGTPTIVEGTNRAELVTNATKFVRGYDAETGKELWRLAKNSEITVPTPITAHGLVFVTSGYRPVQPIYAIRPGATGDISLKEKEEANAHIAWSKAKGGPYMPTPIVYGDHLYTCSNAGILACFDAKTGKQIYQKRMGGKDGYTASSVAADGRLYFACEGGEVRVVKAGTAYELLAINRMDDVCMATPAISDGMIFIRTEHFLLGIGRTETAQQGKGG